MFDTMGKVLKSKSLLGQQGDVIKLWQKSLMNVKEYQVRLLT